MKISDRRAGGRLRRLAIGSVLLVLLAGCSADPTPRLVSQGASPNPNRLTWAPPPCGDAKHGCVDLYLRNTGSHQTPSLDNNMDYRIHLPTSGPLVGGITITGRSSRADHRRRDRPDPSLLQ